MEIKEELLDLEDIKRSKKSLLDLFIRRTAVVTQIREDLTDLVIRDQWRHALKVASSDTQVSEIDLPMIGLLYLSETKAKKKIKLFENRIGVYKRNFSKDEKELQKQLIHIQRYEKIINNIKNKLKQPKNEV
jgi:hypothetical protein